MSLQFSQKIKYASCLFNIRKIKFICCLFKGMEIKFNRLNKAPKTILKTKIMKIKNESYMSMYN